MHTKSSLNISTDHILFFSCFTITDAWPCLSLCLLFFFFLFYTCFLHSFMGLDMWWLVFSLCHRAFFLLSQPLQVLLNALPSQMVSYNLQILQLFLCTVSWPPHVTKPFFWLCHHWIFTGVPSYSFSHRLLCMGWPRVSLTAAWWVNWLGVTWMPCTPLSSPWQTSSIYQATLTPVA